MIADKELFLIEVRQFLEPLWLRAHTDWGEISILLSPYMCRYTCIFLKQILLNNFQEEWKIISGRPFNWVLELFIKIKLTQYVIKTIILYNFEIKVKLIQQVIFL